MRDLFFRSALFTAALCALSMTAAPAFAADPPRKEGSFGTAKAGGGYLTREQLRTCIARQAKTKEQDAELLKEQNAITAHKEEIARVGDALKARLESVDRSNAEAVAVYNDAAKARDAQVDGYQGRVEAFNKRVDAHQAERESFGQSCSNRRYFEEDEIAIRKGK